MLYNITRTIKMNIFVISGVSAISGVTMILLEYVVRLSVRHNWCPLYNFKKAPALEFCDI